MASPQLENGYTKIANEIMEVMCRTPEIMKGAMFPVIAVVWRQTYGWNKTKDAISVSQFVEKTGYSKRTIIYTLQELEAKNVLIIERGASYKMKDTNIISFNKNYKTWVVQNSAQQVEKNRSSAKLRKKVVQNSAKNVRGFAHTKETITKENTKDNSKVVTLRGVSKSKNKERKVAIVEDMSQFNPLGAEVIYELIKIDPKNKTYYNNKTQRAACDFLIEEYGLEEVKSRIAIVQKTNGIPFFPTITTAVQLRDKWVQLEKALERYQKENKSTVAF